MRSAANAVLISFSLTLAAAVQAAGSIQVSYVQPEKFADIGISARDREETLRELTKHFDMLADRYLTDGEALKIEVLDVDVAGAMRPSIQIGYDIRVVKGEGDWPVIKLRYALEAPGQAARRGESILADKDYARRTRQMREPLHYEKRMLDEWFATQFGPAAPK
jgi:Protein of unknown function (DUF3016)